MGSRTTITIARKLGCGGSFIGQAVASGLGLRYVDRETLHLAAEALGVKEEDAAARQEKLASFLGKMFSVFTYGAPDGPYTPPPLRPLSDKQLFDKQTEILKDIAGRENCVIVGCAGAHVLPPHAWAVNIFLHAPVSFRVRRLMEVYQVTSEEEARRMIEESDPMRRKYFTEMTGKDWACADNYHLSIDTSSIPFPDIAEMIIGFIKRKAGGDHA